MRAWILVASVVFSGCQSKSPELSPAERFNIESEALERLNKAYVPFSQAKIEATIYKDPEAIKRWDEVKSETEAMEAALEKQQIRVNEARRALSK